MRFIIFVIDSTSNSAGGDEMIAIDAFNDRLRANNQWIYAAGIGDPDAATVLDNRNQQNIATVGSLFSSPEHYSGFWIIQTDSPESALKLAAEGSAACNRRVELRPFLGN